MATGGRAWGGDRARAGAGGAGGGCGWAMAERGPAFCGLYDTSSLLQYCNGETPSSLLTLGPPRDGHISSCPNLLLPSPHPCPLLKILLRLPAGPSPQSKVLDPQNPDPSPPPALTPRFSGGDLMETRGQNLQELGVEGVKAWRSETVLPIPSQSSGTFSLLGRGTDKLEGGWDLV